MPLPERNGKQIFFNAEYTEICEENTKKFPSVQGLFGDLGKLGWSSMDENGILTCFRYTVNGVKIPFFTTEDAEVTERIFCTLL